MVNFKQALLVPNIPGITQTLLNLAKFMEHCEEPTVSNCIHYTNDFITVLIGDVAVEQ